MSFDSNMADSYSTHAGASPEQVAGSEPRRRQISLRSCSHTSKRRVWLFRTIAVLFPFGCVAFVNVILYWAGIGIDTSLVISNDRLPEGVFFLNPQSDIAYGSEDLWGPEPRTFALPKQQDTFRVLVVGGSSVQGYPYQSELAFPRQMKLVLGRQLSGKNVEVLNAGIVGVSTKPLVDLVSQAAAASPDVIVLYAGHNEFYGIGGVATNARIGEFEIQCRHFRLVQVLSSWRTTENATSGELISRLPNDLEISIGSALFTKAQRQYKNNLTKILNICSRARIPLLMCSVVSNLRNQSPVRSDEDSGQAERERRDQFEQQVSRLIAQEQFTAANEHLAAAKELLPKSAFIQYRQAQCLEGLGNRNDARDCYSLARDLDGCRFRAPGSFRTIVKQLASQRANEDIHFLDLEPVFAEASAHAAPGHDLFLDHVHFTIAGSWLAAKTIAKAIVEDVRGEAWNADAVPSQSERDAWLGVSVEDHLVAVGLAFMLLQQPPFDRSIDADFRFLGESIENYLALLSEEEKNVFMSLDNNTKIFDLVNGLGRSRLSMGDINGALDLFERGKRRRPWEPDSYVLAAICHNLLGRKNETVSNIERSFRTPIVESASLVNERNELMSRLEMPVGQRD